MCARHCALLCVRSNQNRAEPAQRRTVCRALPLRGSESRARHARAALPWTWLACCVLLACSKNDVPMSTPGAQTSTRTNTNTSAAGTIGAAGVSAGNTSASGGFGGSAPSTSGAGQASPVTAGTGSGASGSSAGSSANSAGSGAAGVQAPPSATSGSGGASAGSSAGSAGAGSMGNSGTDLWIASDGVDTNPGTQAMPLHSLAAAVSSAKPGMTIWVAPGSYPTAQTVALKANGTEQSPIRISALPGERPVFDFMAQPRGDGSARGLELSGDYWHITGLELENAGDNCLHISGSHNTIEQLVIHGCGDTGLQITANSSDAGDKTRAANNTVLNCDSYENYDKQNSGENADGFAAKLYIGPGNAFRGCRSWNNADDGWDLFASDDVVTFDNCWAIANGKIGPSQNNTNGDGNGFKLGGAARAGDANMGGAVHILKNCLAIENAACGFVRNNNPDVPQLTMCGGQGDGKGLLCSLTISGQRNVSSSAAQAIAAKRDAAGNLPALP
jgi:pectate disaccharide-lyase